MSRENDLNVLIRTGLTSPIAIGLAKSLLEEARIPFFNMDQKPRGAPGERELSWLVERSRAAGEGSRGARDSAERGRNQVGHATGSKPGVRRPPTRRHRVLVPPLRRIVVDPERY